MRKQLTWLTVIVALLALGAAACGGSDDSTATAVASEEARDDDADAHEDDADADADHEELALFDEQVVETLSVEMQDVLFVPETLTIQAGDLVALMLDNTGAIAHDFTIDRIDADHVYGEMVVVDGHNEHGDEYAMHHALDGGHASEMRLRAHEPGEYEFWCTVPGHREAGMVGTLIVE